MFDIRVGILIWWGMARPLRAEFEDAIYHLCVRGNARQRICPMIVLTLVLMLIAFQVQRLRMLKHWELIADNLSKAGWSWGCVSAIDFDGRTIWIVDAHRDDGKSLVVRAEEILTAFL
jgi:hypothetical protein